MLNKQVPSNVLERNTVQQFCYKCQIFISGLFSQIQQKISIEVNAQFLGTILLALDFRAFGTARARANKGAASAAAAITRTSILYSTLTRESPRAEKSALFKRRRTELARVLDNFCKRG